MAESPTEVDVLMLLCDAAQSVGGKLYILGGGWSQVPAAPGGIPMALALKVAVPWDRANEQIGVRASLVTEDGSPVNIAGNPVVFETNIEVGRPTGVRRGTPLDASLAVNLQGVPLGPGGYAWHLEVDGEVKARTPFRVIGG